MIKITAEMQQRVDPAFEEQKYCVWAGLHRLERRAGAESDGKAV